MKCLLFLALWAALVLCSDKRDVISGQTVIGVELGNNKLRAYSLKKLNTAQEPTAVVLKGVEIGPVRTILFFFDPEGF